jgi:hypothetical protein
MSKVFSITIVGITLLLNACSTIAVPKIDFMGDSEFQEEAQNIDPTIPSASDVPAIPLDVRTAEAWDRSANDMLSLKNEVEISISENDLLSPNNLEPSFQTLKDQVHAYKADDPQ